jgi:CBS domain-containing protein
MDGGRILRAIRWKERGDRYAATRNAATVGRAFGYLLIAIGVYLILKTDNPFNGIWLALIGWFLSNAAEASVAQLSVERSLRGVKVRDVMEADPPSVGPNESVADLVNERMMKAGQRSFLVRHDDGGLAGIVTLSDVRRIPREQWEEARVTDIMTRFADLATIGPDDRVQPALKLLQEREVNQLPVVGENHHDVLGLLTRAGIVRLIEARMRLGV